MEFKGENHLKNHQAQEKGRDEGEQKWFDKGMRKEFS